MSTAVDPVAARIGPESAGVPMTSAEFDAITDVDELFDYDSSTGFWSYRRPAERLSVRPMNCSDISLTVIDSNTTRGVTSSKPFSSRR